MFRNINMKRVNGNKHSITHQDLGDMFEYYSGLVTVKHQIKHLGDVFRKYRSDKVSVLGEINSNNRGVFEQEKRG